MEARIGGICILESERDSELTRGERAADVVRNGMGSWPFVFVFVAIMGIWAGFNGNTGFDPYPFILLNLFLSMLAGMQGAILLISAKRADAISSEVAIHTPRQHQSTPTVIEANTAPDRDRRRTLAGNPQTCLHSRNTPHADRHDLVSSASSGASGLATRASAVADRVLAKRVAVAASKRSAE